ncbi:hypothetical protein [Confluentibacter sediminis]|uniref:hypothetical protein n=1 Tax=Confluentibacter sediminis TaxID=2219045 RepID=UPI000DAEB56F|nr:hypothetical protein [Confluentibacter sediminis]
MKTIFLLPILAFLTVCTTQSQEKDFEFNRLHTRKLELKGQSASEIYSVSYAAIEESTNPEYTTLKTELEKLVADSLSKKADYDKALAKINDISIIKNKVIAFNNSSESFGKKVTLLKESQILALKHHMRDLFYSDNEINKEMKAGFLLLTLKPEDMKVHLNKIVLKLDAKIKAPEMPTYVSSVALREKLSHTKKKLTKDSKSANGYMLQNNMVSPEDIAGNFELVNSYYVLSMPTHGFSKNQLVSKKAVLSLGIPSKKLYSFKEKMLIQNKRTKEMYLVDNSFINNFSVKS